MPWLSDASETRFVWPHQVAENEIRFSLTVKILNNGEEVRPQPWTSINWQSSPTGITSANARIELFDLESPWEQLLIEATVSVPSVETFRVTTLPEGSSAQLQYALVARDSRTRKQWVATAPFIAESRTPTLVLDRSDLFGELVLQPSVVLTSRATHDPLRYATEAGSIVGTGFPISVWLDEPGARPGAGLRCFWQKFPPETGDALYRLAIEPVGDEYIPKIYINSNHLILRAVIDYGGHKKPRASVRDSLFAMMATGVWIELAEYAVGVASEDLEKEDPRRKLAERILKTMKARIRKSLSDLRSDFESEDGRAGLSARVQNWMKVASKETSLIETFEAGDESE